MATKLEELKITLGAALDACDAAMEGNYGDMGAIAAANDALAAASAAYYAELKKTQNLK
jgi:hypothetical protein